MQLKPLIKSVLPYGVVNRVLFSRELHRIGFSPMRACWSALSPGKIDALKLTRLHYLPNKILPHLKYVVDVGANEGLWTQGILKLCKPIKIIMLEPSPDLYAQLRSRLSNYPDVKILNLAAGREKGTTELHITSHSSNYSILRPKEEMNRFYGYGWTLEQKIMIEVDTLDNILADLPEVSLLKIDVQGYEKFVLEGSRDTLRRTKIVILEVGFFSHYEGDTLFSELHNMMSASGFYLQNIALAPSKEGRAPWGDAIYISERLRPDFLNGSGSAL